MSAGRKHRTGHLFFKYVQGGGLENSAFHSSKALGAELHRRGLIELYRENERGGLDPVGSIEQATWYGYTAKGFTRKELETILSKGAA
jgi:hypothetical protein